MTSRRWGIYAIAALLSGCHTVELVNSNASMIESDTIKNEAWDHNVLYAFLDAAPEPSIKDLCNSEQWTKVVIEENFQTTATTWLMHYVPIVTGAAIAGLPGVYAGVALIAHPAYNNVTLVYSPVNVEAFCLSFD